MEMPENSACSNASHDPSSDGNRTPADQANRLPDEQIVLKDTPSTTHQQPAGEEPEMALEPDLPSDGRDVVGEAMIRALPPRSELAELPSQPNFFKQQT